MGAEAVSGLNDVCLMLFIRNLLSKGSKGKWIGHLGLDRVLMSIYGVFGFRGVLMNRALRW